MQYTSTVEKKRENTDFHKILINNIIFGYTNHKNTFLLVYLSNYRTNINWKIQHLFLGTY